MVKFPLQNYLRKPLLLCSLNCSKALKKRVFEEILFKPEVIFTILVLTSDVNKSTLMKMLQILALYVFISEKRENDIKKNNKKQIGADSPPLLLF